MQVPLEPCDRVVAAFPVRGEVVIIITEQGTVFELRVAMDAFDDRISINRR